MSSFLGISRKLYRILLQHSTLDRSASITIGRRIIESCIIDEKVDYPKLNGILEYLGAELEYRNILNTHYKYLNLDSKERIEKTARMVGLELPKTAEQ
ncbi:hypothetical protein ROZALSC1DRAFT_28458 [Rozella allomycis CSF55]|uniref:Uncharacterized protein n=1 Tax=Rozella allomycis (strain CSF55) TaxID=988480 RepID=A0A075AQ36_ROZAC|nr:hypothetical protein O9G_003080 [Rozella allomycis CSF55]RKP20008.1 hypothetical protein ROZALSC1DRAFT_28458 [Rozella allomycis CSF55]|eukprot:EPZ30845.1 hypothetical protein O9G_003080 [Rozella allomycis CSF55]